MPFVIKDHLKLSFAMDIQIHGTWNSNCPENSKILHKNYKFFKNSIIHNFKVLDKTNEDMDLKVF